MVEHDDDDDDDDDDAATYDDTVSAARHSHWKEDIELVQQLDFSSSSLVAAPTFATPLRSRCRPSKKPSRPPTVCTRILLVERLALAVRLDLWFRSVYFFLSGNIFRAAEPISTKVCTVTATG